MREHFRDYLEDYLYRAKDVFLVFVGLIIILVPAFAIGGSPVLVALWRGSCWWLFLFFVSLPAALPWPAFMLDNFRRLKDWTT
jgi:hypothetical protein